MIRFLLLHRISDTDRHPRLMLACTLIAALVALALDPVGPQ
jgi:hypothetical protein